MASDVKLEGDFEALSNGVGMKYIIIEQKPSESCTNFIRYGYMEKYLKIKNKSSMQPYWPL